MPISDNATAEAIRRKLRPLAAVFLDPAATEHEKANAKVLKGRLETLLMVSTPSAHGAFVPGNYSSESKGMIRPIALCRARGSYLHNSPPHPKHDSCPRALGCWFLTKSRVNNVHHLHALQ